MRKALKDFIGRVLHITTPTTDIGSGVIPAHAGVVNISGSNTHDLHRAVLAFAALYEDRRDDTDRLQAQAKEVEGLLLAAVTLDTISEAEGDALIDELHGLLQLS